MAKVRLDDYLVDQGYFPDQDAVLRAVIAREVRVDDVYVSSAALKIKPDAEYLCQERQDLCITWRTQAAGRS